MYNYDKIMPATYDTAQLSASAHARAVTHGGGGVGSHAGGTALSVLEKKLKMSAHGVGMPFEPESGISAKKNDYHDYYSP